VRSYEPEGGILRTGGEGEEEEEKKYFVHLYQDLNSMSFRNCFDLTIEFISRRY
jgi:hypothetical protein